MHRWVHIHAIEVETIQCLSRCQNAKFTNFEYSGYSPACNDSVHVLGGLKNLRVGSLDQKEWPSGLLVKNWSTVRRLQLGCALSIATEYARGDGKAVRNHETVTDHFCKAVDRDLLVTGVHTIPAMVLKQLSLCGVDLKYIAESHHMQSIDLAHLTSLNIESCSGLSDALKRLTALIELKASPLTSQLTSIYLRHENATMTFRRELGTFLSSFGGLKNLHVLLEGSADWIAIDPIVKAHGKTLKFFVWDQRTGPLVSMDSAVAVVPENVDHLKVISEHCRELVGLGLAIDWDQVRWERCYEEVSSLSTHFRISLAHFI